MGWLRAKSESEQLDALALRAQGGDRRAFTRLYRQLHPQVARYVARRVASSADAEDLVSRVFERVVARLAQFDPQRGCIEAWTIRIARNAVIDHARARRPQVGLDQAPELDDVRRDPAAQLLVVEELSELAAKVRACSPEVQQLLSLRFGDGLRHRAIGQLLGISEAAVRKRLSRALRDLREAPQPNPNASPAKAAKEVGYVY